MERTYVYDHATKESLEIRNDVFVKEQGFLKDEDHLDNTAKHIVLFLKDVALATCRLFSDEEEGAYRIGRVAVRKECRRMGYGRKLLSEAEKVIKDLGGEVAKLSAQVQAQGFYEQCGYRTCGEVFVDEGCPHILMRKTLED